MRRATFAREGGTRPHGETDDSATARLAIASGFDTIEQLGGGLGQPIVTTSSNTVSNAFELVTAVHMMSNRRAPFGQLVCIAGSGHRKSRLSDMSARRFLVGASIRLLLVMLG